MPYSQRDLSVANYNFLISARLLPRYCLKMGRTYTMNLVGEQFYQPAISATEEGDLVDVLIEVGNPHDARALVVKHSETEATIGYLPAGSFVHRIAFEEDGSVEAEIETIFDVDGVKHIKIAVTVNYEEETHAVDYEEESPNYLKKDTISNFNFEAKIPDNEPINLPDWAWVISIMFGLFVLVLLFN